MDERIDRWLRGGLAAAVIAPAAVAVLVLLPACGQFTDVCSSQRYSWTLFSGGRFAGPGLTYVGVTGGGAQVELDRPVNWFTANAKHSSRGPEAACEARGDLTEVVRLRGQDEVDRHPC